MEPFKVNTALVLGIDISEDGAAIVVGKLVNGQTHVLNTVFGDRAVEVYKELIGLSEKPIHPNSTLN